MKITVVGAGSWGTALANMLAQAGHEVVIWAHEPEVAAAISSNRENPLFLPGCSLETTLKATNDLDAAIGHGELLVLAVPSHVLASVVERFGPKLAAESPLMVCATKGIETSSLRLMSEVIQDLIPGARFVALSGPSFAKEVYQGQPTAVVAAGSTAAAELVQQVFATPRFRVYTSTDVIGVEVGGAMKNVIAIASGVLSGLGLGHNPRAALVTRGLAEITRLGVAMGGEAATFAGLAGMGDLILTTYGELSRNRSLGEALAHGTTVEQWQDTHRVVAEGVNATKAAVRIAELKGVVLPITTQVYELLVQRTTPEQAVAELMGRNLKAENQS